MGGFNFGINKNENLPKWHEIFYNIAMTLKELRKRNDLTQPEAAFLIGVPLRTYCRYEDDVKDNNFKYNQMISVLTEKSKTLVLKFDTLKKRISETLTNYSVSACYLFGSYAKNKATSESDVDLMIVSDIEGIEYYRLLNDLEEKLGKKVDLLRLETAIQNVKLMNEILKEGIKIFG